MDTFRFADFSLEPGARQLRRGVEVVALGARETLYWPNRHHSDRRSSVTANSLREMWKGAFPAVRGLDLDQPFQSLRDRALHLGMAQCTIAFSPNGRLEFSR